ncbi:SAF domain-containing protein [Actinomyces dentalis]|jgi:hypothetical protein|uniref:SAF domain-containing protein n=1 Tax=Actinomyces dentalis TaxID=272548 RepID=UPI00235535A8|nr:SAF domain-containing protein [Actinomyces dentalis]
MSTPTDARTARRRDRDARGTASTRSRKRDAARDRLPAAPRERRPLLAALAIILIVGGALIAGLLAVRMDQREEMLMAADTIEAGQQIELADLVSAPVSATGSVLIPASRAGEVVGMTARVQITKGELIQTTQLSADSPVSDGRTLVGISLEAGRFPAGGLSAGDVVTVIDIKDGSAAVARAQVLEAAPSSGTAGDWSSGAVVSLLVPREAAGSTATLGAAGNAAVVVTATHQPIGDS